VANLNAVVRHLDALDQELGGMRRRLDELNVAPGLPAPPPVDLSPLQTAIERRLEALDQHISRVARQLTDPSVPVSKTTEEDIKPNLRAYGALTEEARAQVYFDTGSAGISDASEQELTRLNVYSGSQWFFDLVGFTDLQGSSLPNGKLGQERAEAVSRWLIEHASVPVDHINARSGGQTNQFGIGDAQNLNRTVVVYVLRNNDQ
jgi:outer membrane protein OmpA-like peptidoglycan-associated protein